MRTLSSLSPIIEHAVNNNKASTGDEADGRSLARHNMGLI